MIKVLTEEGEDSRIYQEAAERCYQTLSLRGQAAVYLNFTDDEEMREINLAARKADYATDVLSFPLLTDIKEFNRQNYPFEFLEQEAAVLLGDIVINRDAVQRQAAEYCTGSREPLYLFVHGLLHLLGYDHNTTAQKSRMRQAEEQILDGLV